MLPFDFSKLCVFLFESVYFYLFNAFWRKDMTTKADQSCFLLFHINVDGINPAGWSSDVLIHCTVNSHRYAFSNILTFMITNTLYIFIAKNKSNEISDIWSLILCTSSFIHSVTEWVEQHTSGVVVVIFSTCLCSRTPLYWVLLKLNICLLHFAMESVNNTKS